MAKKKDDKPDASEFNRREFLKIGTAAAAGAAVGAVATQINKENSTDLASSSSDWPRLSQPIDQLSTEKIYNFAVVGSGYGASIVAARISKHLRDKGNSSDDQLIMLERGMERQPGEYPATLFQAQSNLRLESDNLGVKGNRLGLFCMHQANHYDAVVGNGLGGGSNINANVVLEPYPHIFEPSHAMNPDYGPGEIRWPKEITYGELVPYFAKVRSMLKAERYRGMKPEYKDYEKFKADIESAEARQNEVAEKRGLTADEMFPSLKKVEYMNDSYNRWSSYINKEAGEPDKGELASTEDVKFELVPLAVNFTQVDDVPNENGVRQKLCTLCGDCVSGCNVGAKNTLIMNYIPHAVNHGAKVFCQIEVSHVEKKYDHYVLHANYYYRSKKSVRDTNGAHKGGSTRTVTVLAKKAFQIKARNVVLGAGTMGTSKILLQSKQNGLPLSAQVGKKFSGNADVLGFGFNTNKRTDSMGFGTKQGGFLGFFQSEIDINTRPRAVGPCIVSMIDMRHNKTKGFLIEEGAFPSVMLNLLKTGLSLVLSNLRQSGQIQRLARRTKDLLLVNYSEDGAINHSMCMLAMGYDKSIGEISLSNGCVSVNYPNQGQENAFSEAKRAFEYMAAANEGVNMENPRTALSDTRQTPVTVHALGGAVMGEDVSRGVVNHKGQVFNPSGGIHKGLYCSCGSVIPIAVGSNPFLTISAVAERIAAKMIEDIDRGQIDLA